MKILILNRYALDRVPYREWIDDEHELVLLTRAGALPPVAPEGYAEIAALDDYTSTAMVEFHAYRLHDTYRFDAVLAMSEFDILRSAALREAWGLPGQGVRSATAYRDKLVMKQVLSAAGVPVTPYGAVDSATDLLEFTRRHDYPVVVKPRTGASSVDVHVLRDRLELERFLGPGCPIRTDQPAHLIAERFVPNEMYTVDGCVRDGEVRLCWPSQITNGLAFESGDPLLSSALEPDDPYRAALVELTTSAVKALPTPNVSLFHAEVFRTPDGELVFNEIGCRVGGGKIRDMLIQAFGVDLLEWYVRHAFGTGDRMPTPAAAPRTQAGWLLAPPRPGVVTSVPSVCPLPAVKDYDLRVGVGTELTESTSSVDCVAAMVVVGDTRRVVLDELGHAMSWLNDSLVLA